MVRGGHEGGRRPRWLFSQRWQQFLFAHWQVEPADLEPVLPRGVEPDIRDGTAWLGIVAFVMVDTRTIGAPRRLVLPPTPELNVRTYVRVGSATGVWFLSLDASSRAFVNVGRALYGLQYRLARMTACSDGDRVHYLSEREDAAFGASYAPAGPPATAEAGSREDFLFERYRLFATRRGTLMSAQVAHEPWALHPAEAELHVNCMAPRGLCFEGQPLLHFSPGVNALISAPERVTLRPQPTVRSSRARARELLSVGE